MNIIGEHTDYNNGYALPAAIDRYCYVAHARNDKSTLNVVSRNLGETAELAADTFIRRGHWTDYVGAVASALRDEGFPIAGCDLWIESEVPPGAGVSSSAALEVAVAAALIGSVGGSVERASLAKYAWVAETRYVGVPCGPMDQIASACGLAEHALLLDCRTLTTTSIAMPKATAVLVIDSGVRHAHVNGAYAVRRAECAEAATLLGLASLRDAGEAHSADPRLNDLLRGRVRHVLSENARVLATAQALQANDPFAAGRLMQMSHESLRTDFDATCAETDLLAGLACAAQGIWGARQMGGGFGGCVVALAEAEYARQRAEEISAHYTRETGQNAAWCCCILTDGCSEIVL